jgi:hypothetical protein
MGLTIKEIDNAKPNGKPHKMADSGGLCLLVAPSGAKSSESQSTTKERSPITLNERDRCFSKWPPSAEQRAAG